ncbi:MAG: hypothetical protein C0605_14410 [Hyphomicrobiales bacterium]|nr:MAG: hypothetical protein C0605_14410 [Hyphomicrobiales bacterium]
MSTLFDGHVVTIWSQVFDCCPEEQDVSELKKSLRNGLETIHKDMRLPFRLLRFTWVGIASSLLYVLFVILFVEIASITSQQAAVLSYLCALVINYYAHRNFTFRSQATRTPEISKFLVLHAFNLMISFGCMLMVVNWLGMPYIFGAFLAAALVPVSTFLIMNFWVFGGYPST